MAKNLVSLLPTLRDWACISYAVEQLATLEPLLSHCQSHSAAWKIHTQSFRFGARLTGFLAILVVFFTDLMINKWQLIDDKYKVCINLQAFWWVGPFGLLGNKSTGLFNQHMIDCVPSVTLCNPSANNLILSLWSQTCPPSSCLGGGFETRGVLLLFKNL